MTFNIKLADESLPLVLAHLKIRRQSHEDEVHSAHIASSLLSFVRGNSVRYGLLQELCEELGHHPLVELHVVISIIPATIMAALIRQTAGTLERIRLENVLFTGDTEDLFASLVGHPSLKKFILEGQCKFEPYQDLSLFMRPLATCSKLAIVFWADTNEEERAEYSFGPAVQELCQSPSLHKLTLLEFPKLNSSSIVRVLQCIKTNTSLRVLIFGSRRINEVGAIASVLLENSTLEELTISIGENSRPGPVIEALKMNRHLKRLDLRDQWLTNANCLALRNMLEDNYVVEALLPTCPPHHDFCFVEFYMKLNQLGRGRLLEDESTTQKDWVETMISHSYDESVVFYLLSKNPSLCQMALPTERTRKSWRSLRSRKRPKRFASYTT